MKNLSLKQALMHILHTNKFDIQNFKMHFLFFLKQKYEADEEIRFKKNRQECIHFLDLFFVHLNF